MKIVHLCLSNFYIEGFGYQENLLPKYHKKDGHDVTIIASRFSYNKENGQPEMADEGEYINSDGIKVIRINYKYKWLGKINDKIKVYKDTYKLLEKEQPDLIFCHGIQFLDLKEVVSYVKNNPHCKLVADNHASYDNSARNFLSKEILHKIFYKKTIQHALPYINKIFMIAPGCKKFAEDMYDIPEEKMEYLYLGADTEKIDFRNKDKIRYKIREELGIKNSDFVLITGGKLNKGKNIKWLIEIIKSITYSNLKLIIFGVFTDDIKVEMLDLIKTDYRIKYIGWVEADDVYDYYLASDVAIFLGTKSILWEQAICSGLPLICRRWKGMEYVDVGGNCIFIDENDKEKIINSIKLLMNDNVKLKNMSSIARTKGFEKFSYEKISKQAIVE